MPTTPTVRLDGDALCVIRQKDGHTLTTLAAASGYTVGYINDLEKGRRKGNATVVRRLADVLNVPMSMLERREETAA